MLRSVNLENFRNHHLASFEFSPTATAIVGSNGIGKTNLLESIYLGSLTKSWRTNDHHLIRNGHQYYRVELGYDDGEAAIAYQELPTGKTKQASWKERKIALSQIVGKHPVVLFEPNQTQLFAEQPTLRRRYLDMFLSQVDPLYLSNSRKYRKLIAQRNRLLEELQYGGHQDQLMIYTIQLIDPISYITKARKEYLATIQEPINRLYQQLTKTKPLLITNYFATLDIDEDIGQQYLSIQDREIRARRTLIGPHRDDFGINTDNQPVHNQLSRGELRALLLAIKYAEYSYLTSAGAAPMMLFDDVLSEFDSQRRRRLLETNFDGQLIITTTEVGGDMSNLHIIEL
jgi:DNA replication and repair protein RecF